MAELRPMLQTDSNAARRNGPSMNCRTSLRSALLLCLAFAGCSRSIAIDIPPHTLTVLVYSQGIATQRCDIAPGSEKFRKLKQFMQQNSAGWRARTEDYM